MIEQWENNNNLKKKIKTRKGGRGGSLCFWPLAIHRQPCLCHRALLGGHETQPRVQHAKMVPMAKTKRKKHIEKISVSSRLIYESQQVVYNHKEKIKQRGGRPGDSDWMLQIRRENRERTRVSAQMWMVIERREGFYRRAPKVSFPTSDELEEEITASSLLSAGKTPTKQLQVLILHHLATCKSSSLFVDL